MSNPNISAKLLLFLVEMLGLDEQIITRGLLNAIPEQFEIYPYSQ